MPDIHFIRGEIEHMRSQVAKQRKEILSLQRAGVSTVAAELLLKRMLAKIDTLCADRDRAKAEQPGHNRGRSWEVGDGKTRAAGPLVRS